ncbi:pfkB family carbohydrate kinase [alpha proteobacterium HIMB59]|nr:pfkB family carbohydrate kinase [alpha proteobacterium HIMB59]
MNQTNKIAVIGDIIADEYIIGSSDRLSPEHPSPVIKDIKSEIRCGGAANVAVCLSELTKDIDIFLTRTNDSYMTKVLSILKKKKSNFILKKQLIIELLSKKEFMLIKVRL